nr:PKD domain-containing protein [Bacteroidota bacterium]
MNVNSITGGSIDGECYLLLTAFWGMYDKGYAFVLHSTDNGKTFQVNHPVAWGGSQPVHTNFSAPQSEGTAPLTVEWCNYSIGENLSYSWDFENDGIVDSNEESPVFTYEEPGTYSVKLHLSGEYADSLVREDYIIVYPPPPMPQGLSAEVINDDVYLNWQQVSSNDLIGYKVYRDTVLLTPEPISDTTFAEYKMPNGSYEYCVSAVYPYGVSQQTCVQADITVGIEDYPTDGLRIIAHRASGQIGISFPGTFNLRVFNISGQEIYSKNNCRNREKVLTGQFIRGVYIFVVEDRERSISRKVALF